MVPSRIMFVAGETSGDQLAAQIVPALRMELARRQGQYGSAVQPLECSLAPHFFGAGGPHLRAAGVELALDLTAHAVIGLWEVFTQIRFFRRAFRQLLQLAVAREPQAIVLVDFSGFNRRFAHAIRAWVRRHAGPFFNWNPKLIYCISPQVWASRPKRAQALAADIDLLLSIFPFEKEWYAKRAPRLRVEYVGHPLLDRWKDWKPLSNQPGGPAPLILLLPGSRPGELKAHLPILVRAAEMIRQKTAAEFRLIAPDAGTLELARRLVPGVSWISLQAGRFPEALAVASLAIASTGTVTLECAYFGVPAVALYKTSWFTYQVGKRVVTVPFLAMPNLLAGQEIYPEFIQQAASPERLSAAALEILQSPRRREEIRERLRPVIGQLGPPGASGRMASRIAEVMAGG